MLTAVKIHTYHPHHATDLAIIYNQLYPQRPLTASILHQRMTQLNGRIWVISVASTPVAYALTTPLPGLPGVAHLEGGVAIAWQRQGIGSALLTYIQADLQTDGIRQLSCNVTGVTTPTAQFLYKHHFFVEHEEWMMQRHGRLPPLQLPPHLQIKTLPRSRAIPQFCALYDQSFSPHPWYQPYTPEEIVVILKRADDLLFLMLADQPIGVAWIHRKTANQGRIEPIGLIPEQQGNGYGRLLLLASLHRLAKRGMMQVQLGVWATNFPAIHLYQTVGFQRQHNLIYMAYNI